MSVDLPRDKDREREKGKVAEYFTLSWPNSFLVFYLCVAGVATVVVVGGGGEIRRNEV